MKNRLVLFLILISPLFILNCSGKKTQPLRPSVHTSTTNTSPSLGTPIRVPNSIIKEPQNTPRPVTHREARYGKSSLRKKFKLSNTIKESSALIKIDNQLWTLNDSGDKAKLYQINERNGNIVKSVNISNAKNKDWEDMAYDDNYIYIGDFGNNRGNRRDLKIYKIPRASLRTQRNIRAEIISFSYNDQKDFSSKPSQTTNHDCEAMVAYHGKLYLFSKNWQNKKTRLYELSTNAGKQIAKYKSTFNTNGMVTGASLNKELDILLLTTYSSLLNVNVWAFTNYRGGNFFNGASKKLNFPNPLQAQVEGVTFTGNYKAYLSSEAFSKYIFSFDASLYELDFGGEFE